MFSLSWVVLICFFFFKQKTAYEMRISDWSSDVCSSDLKPYGLSVFLRTGPSRRWLRENLATSIMAEVHRVAALALHFTVVVTVRHAHVPFHCLTGRIFRRGRWPRDPRPTPDRQNVVSGQSVSVRVDLGGGLILKKKTNTQIEP